MTSLIHWVAWGDVTKPKDKGGLGINKLEDCNNALIIKWLWRYRVESGALWKKVVDAIHLSPRNWEPIPYKRALASTWSKIVSFGSQIKRLDRSFVNTIRGKVGDGKKIRFWLDPWVEERSLKDLYPDLFRLEKYKFCYVEDRFNQMADRYVASWDWRSYPESDNEVQQLIQLHRTISGVDLCDNEDDWRWEVGSNVVFTVKEARKWLVEDNNNSHGAVFKWCSWVPNKCNIFMWRSSRDRIPTCNALRRRNVYVEDDKCSLCGEIEETTSHIFAGCRFVMEVWAGISNWCKLPPLFAFSVLDIVQMAEYLQLQGVKKELVHGILIVTCWRIWKARNEKVFASINPEAIKIVADIKALGFLWYKSRFRKDTVDWSRWSRFSFDVT